MGKKKAETAKAFADMTPEEQEQFVADLQAKNATLAKNLKEKKAAEVDTSFEVDGETYDFDTKKFNLDGEVIDVVELINEDSVASNAKLDKVCARLVEIGSGFITKKG